MAIRSTLKDASLWYYGSNYISRLNSSSFVHHAPISAPGESLPPRPQAPRIPIISPPQMTPAFQPNDQAYNEGNWRNALRGVRGPVSDRLNNILTNGSFYAEIEQNSPSRRLFGFKQSCKTGKLAFGLGLGTVAGISITVASAIVDLVDEDPHGKKVMTATTAAMTWVTTVSTGVCLGIKYQHEIAKMLREMKKWAILEKRLKTVEKTCDNYKKRFAADDADIEKMRLLENGQAGYSEARIGGGFDDESEMTTSFRPRNIGPRLLESCEESEDEEENDGEDDNDGDGDEGGDGGDGGGPPPPPPPPPPMPPVPPPFPFPGGDGSDDDTTPSHIQ